VKKLFGTTETHYVDGFQYKTVGSEVKLVIIPTSEGYYDAHRDAYFYNFTDHLGNVRLSYSDADGNGVVTGDVVVEECSGGNCSSYIIPGEIEAISNYYPFGMLLENHNNQANSSNVYKYKYNGKELQESGMYDYGARFYMPDLGRWGVVDPLAEISRRFSPYVYGNNNPVRFIDPDGMAAQDTFEAGVQYTGQAAIDMFNAITSFYGYNNSSNNGFPSFNFSYIDPGGAAGSGSGDIISGATASDAAMFREDIFNILHDSKFDSFKSLINIKGKNFSTIDMKSFEASIKDIKLSVDERRYLDILVAAINSDKVHTIEYLTMEQNASNIRIYCFK
jgi:RHS repeat-associated protein